MNENQAVLGMLLFIAAGPVIVGLAYVIRGCCTPSAHTRHLTSLK